MTAFGTSVSPRTSLRRVNPLQGVLTEAWETYKKHASHLVTLALIVYVIAAVLSALLGMTGVFGALLASLVTLIASFVSQVGLVKAADDVRDGRVDHSVSDTLRATQPYLVRVAVASLLAGIAIGIGFLLLIVPGLILLTLWCLIVPVIVLENSAVGAAFTRSRDLVRGHEMNVFGTLVLVFLALVVVGVVVGVILSPLPNAFASALSSLISGALVAPYLAVVLTYGYHRLVAVHAGGQA